MALTRKALGMQAENLADKRQVVVNCSAEEPDRIGDIVVQTGIDFGPFMKIGGTVLWQHDPDQPIAKALEMNIVDGRLRSLVQFPEAGVSPKADEIYGLIRNGVVNSTSIGFAPKDNEPIDPKQPWGPQRFNKIELMEFSFVSVPCAPDATIVARSLNGKVNKDEDHSWKVGASRNLPIDEESSWDGPAAEKSVFDHSGFDDDSPNTSFARKAFLVYDASNPKLKGSYKLPFAKMVDGRLTAVASGIRAAASRLSQTDIPDDVQKTARAVIDHYEAKMKDGKQLTADDIALALSKMTPAQIKEIGIKAGRVLSQENVEHLKAIGECLKGMQDCHKSIADGHEKLVDHIKKSAKLHDDLHDVVVDMMDHGTSLGEHLKALLKSAKKPKEDGDGEDDGADDGTDGDEELAAAVEQRKRLADLVDLGIT